MYFLQASIVFLLYITIIQAKKDPAVGPVQASPASEFKCPTRDVTKGCKTAKSCLHSNPSDDSSYFMCNDKGVATKKDCPAGLVWDKKEKACASPLPPPQVVSTFKCPARDAKCKGSTACLHPHPSSTTSYIQCSDKGVAIKKDCPPGLIFNKKDKSCGRVLSEYSCPLRDATVGCKGSKACLHKNPSDPASYIQCNDDGVAYVMSCPAPLLWNNKDKICDDAANIVSKDQF